MGKLIELLPKRYHATQIPDVAYVRHAQKNGINGDISAQGIRDTLSNSLELTENLREKWRVVAIDDANVERIEHTADNFQLPLREAGILVRRSRRPELSRDVIFLKPFESVLRKKIYETLEDGSPERPANVTRNDRAMGRLLLEWMDKGELGYGITDGTVSFNEAQRIQAHWLHEALEQVRENYRYQRQKVINFRFTHEIQTFVIATFGYKKDRRGGIKKTGKDIVEERQGVTKNLTGPAFYYRPSSDTFTMKLPRYNKYGAIHDYEELDVNEELIKDLAKRVSAVPEEIMSPLYDTSPSLLVKTMRRQVAMGHPIQPPIEIEQDIAA